MVQTRIGFFNLLKEDTGKDGRCKIHGALRPGWKATSGETQPENWGCDQVVEAG